MSLLDETNKKQRRVKKLNLIPSSLTTDPQKCKDIIDFRFTELVIQSKECETVKRHLHKITKNWDKASLHCAIDFDNFKNEYIHPLEKLEFYLEALVPYISPTSIHIGDKIFSMSQIPGREKSFILNKTIELKKSILSFNESKQQHNNINVSTPNNTNNIMFENDSNDRITFFSHESTTMVDNNRFMNMFNNYKYSDLFILLHSGKVLNLHKFVLAAWQCDDEAIKENQYVVTSMDDDIVIKTFKYLYSDGKFNIDDIIDSSECIMLCNQFGIDHKLLKRTKIISPIKNPSSFPFNISYQTSHPPAEPVKEISFHMDSYSIDLSNNDLISNQEMIHSTPICQLNRNNEVFPHSESIPRNNLSDSDLFGSFSRDISISMDCSTEIDRQSNDHLVEKVTISQPDMIDYRNITKTNTVTILESHEEKIIFSPYSVSKSIPSNQSPPFDKNVDDLLSPLPLSQRLNIHNLLKNNFKEDIADDCTIKNPPSHTHTYCSDDNSQSTPCMSDNSHSSVTYLPVSPTINRRSYEETSEFLLSPLPLSERMKLITKSGLEIKSLENKSPKNLINDDSSQNVTVKKKPKMKKSLSDNIKPKKSLKRQSTDTSQISTNPIDANVKLIETKKKRQKIQKLKFETPPKQAFSYNPFTPMPDYENMPSPELQKQRIKYGLKKEFPKKKSIIILQECHRQTHKVDNCDDSESSSISDELDSSDADVISQQLPLRNEEDRVADDSKNNEHLYHFLKVNYFLEILTYKALDVTKIIDELKASNVKQNLKELYDYLDYQCISYKKIDDKQKRFNKPIKTKKFVI